MAQRRTEAFPTRGRVLAGGLLALGLFGGVGGWAMTATLSGAVIVGGVVAVDQNLKTVQHRDGGIVSAIAIREGSRVAEGDLLFRLDDAQTRAEMEIIRAQLLTLRIQRARLLAERDSAAAMEPPEGMDPTDPGIAALLAGETRFFDGKRREHRARVEQLELVIEQVAQEVEGLRAQAAAKTEEIALVTTERNRNEALAKSGLIEAQRLHGVRRDLARLNGEMGEIRAAIARAHAQASEVRVQILAADEAVRTEAQRGLSLAETRIAELEERHSATFDRLARTDIRAPIAGVINDLNVHTLGGVVGAAEVLATIVPADARLTLQIRIPPTQIDQVALGQPARLRFTAFNQRTTPELAGTTAYLAAAATRDGVTGETYFAGEVAVAEDELAALGGMLVPGMSAEVFIATEPRTAMSYLVKPLTDQLQRAFRER